MIPQALQIAESEDGCLIRRKLQGEAVCRVCLLIAYPHVEKHLAELFHKRHAFRLTGIADHQAGMFFIHIFFRVLPRAEGARRAVLPWRIENAAALEQKEDSESHKTEENPEKLSEMPDFMIQFASLHSRNPQFPFRQPKASWKPLLF